MTIGQRIKELRNEHHLSQTALAKQLGIGSANIGFYENGRTKPSEATLGKLCELFNVTREWLLGEEPQSGELEKKEAPADRSTTIYIQSVMGGSITVDEILARVGTAAPDALEIYIKPEENKAYYVGENSRGFVVLWE